MKKNFTLTVFLFFSCITMHAAIYIINVENYQFTPSSLNVSVGDTIRWVWANNGGSHTTASTDVPLEAATWDHPIDALNTHFDYKVTVSGSYSYQCNIHVGMGMVGTFTALSPPPVHIISVADFQFIPASLNVTIGDTIRWVWDNTGSAHTTSATDVPPDALTWDQPIDALNPQFDYIVTVPGSYTYQCIIHSGVGMLGSFTATGALEVPGITAGSDFILNNNISSAEISLTITLNKSGFIGLQLYNMEGSLVKDLCNAERTQGVYSESFSVNDLAKGIYLLKAQTSDNRVVKKIIIQ